MKNLTITLPDELYARMRIEAAREGKSMSKFMAELAERRVGHELTQKQALDLFLTGPELPGIAIDRAGREELYAERLFHRHERDALPERPPRLAEAVDRAKLGRRTRGA